MFRVQLKLLAQILFLISYLSNHDIFFMITSYHSSFFVIIITVVMAVTLLPLRYYHEYNHLIASVK